MWKLMVLIVLLGWIFSPHKRKGHGIPGLKNKDNAGGGANGFG